MPEPAPVGRGATRGLVAALLTAALMPLNSTMVAVAVPAIGREFGDDPGRVTQALVATYLIAAIALQSPGGKLGDRLGHWRMFTVGQVAIGLGAVAGFLAPDLVVLAGCRVLMAIGGAVAVPATLALLRLELPPERRGRAFGTFGATMGLAAALGPILGGVLVDAFGWQAVFLANLPVLAVSAVLAASVPRPATSRSTAPFDWVGSALLTAGLALVVLGAQRTDGSAVPVVAGALALLGGLVAWERRVADPVLAFDLFRSVPFSAGTAVIGLQNLVMYALLFELPLVLAKLFHADARESGQLLVFMTVAMVLTSLVAGRMTDRLGPRPVAVAGSVSCLVGAVLMETSNLSSVGSLRPSLVLLGIGLGLSGPAAQTASLSSIDRDRSGIAAGVGSTVRYLGGVVGIALLGRMLDIDAADAIVRHDHHVVLAVFLGVLTAALLAAALLPGRAPAVRAAGVGVPAEAGGGSRPTV
jgi:EmrB/QacA subfamily drug resistance transporter